VYRSLLVNYLIHRHGWRMLWKSWRGLMRFCSRGNLVDAIDSEEFGCTGR